MRHYDIQRINGLPQEQVTPPANILARIKRESALDAERMQRDSPGAGFSQGFDWPVPGIISSIYGSQRILNGTPMSPHLGVDVAAPQGTPIRAPADAMVSLVADQYLNGGFTILDHGHGVSTNYVHQINIRVREGDHVSKGQVMSEVGATGRATGPNLHWGMNWFSVKLDPSLATPAPTPPKA
jgi:murein DD-endopeptidase MepM/ murein hydrolase activator NlpD